MVYDYQTWLKELRMQAYDDDNLHWGQMSSEVKCGKLFNMVTKLGQKNPWYKFIIMMTFVEVKGRQSLNDVVNYAPWLPNLVKRILGASYDNDDHCWVQWSSEVKCGRLNYTPRLPNLVRRIPDAGMMMVTFMEAKGYQR